MSGAAGEDGVIRTPGFPLGQDQQGRSVYAVPYNREVMKESINAGLKSKLSEADAVTEDPENEDGEISTTEGGPVRRFNDIFTDLGSVQLEQVALDGHEIANATATLRNEMYRSKFPLVLPRFTVKCRDDDCGAEYDEDLEFCLQCAREEMEADGVSTPPTDPAEIPEGYQDHPVRYPDPSQKRDAARMAESVNKEGQSLRELMKELEDDQSRLGVSVLIVKHKYWVAEGDSGIYHRGEVINERTDELVRADPKHVVPVVDENGRIGNYWYTCPVHRERGRVKHDDYLNGRQHCDECGCELREVHFVEHDYTRSGRGSKPSKYYFENEVITWARYFPRLHGLDGLSPVHHVWIKQAILHWMDIYGAAFFDPESDRFPKKFLVVHTTNPDAWERNFDQARVEAKENPYDQKVFMNEFSSESRSTPEVQVIDLMSDNLMGQDEQIRDRYKQDIRTQFGVTNVFDSELKDAGGLNNEGLQLEVTDRNVASAMLDTEQGPLDELSKTLGFDDYLYGFVPPEEADVEDLRAHIQAGLDAAQAGLDARLEDHSVQVDDGDFQDEEGGGMGGLAGLFQQAEDSGWPPIQGKAVGDDDFTSNLETFRLLAPEGSDKYTDEVLGVGVDMPNSGVYIDWNLEAFEDPLSGPHVSDYDTIEDLQKVTDGVVERADGDGEKARALADAHAETPDPDAETDGTDRTPSAKGKASEKTSEEGEEGKARGGEVGEKLAQLRTIDDAFEHIVWADETNKAEPFWDDNQSVPQFVQDIILEVIDRSIYADIESLPRREMERLERIFKRRLTQPQGWSLRSLTEDIESAFGIPTDDAELVARTETASILNNAREEGYRELGVDDAVFRWIGPHDHRTTDACEWMKEVTDRGAGEMVAKHGRPRSVDTVGEPLPLDDLIALEQEAARKFFPHLEWRKHTIHPNERHSFVETFKATVRGSVFPAGDPRGDPVYEVDFKLDLAPAMGGTFAAA